jgi:hypothetical protein
MTAFEVFGRDDASMLGVLHEDFQGGIRLLCLVNGQKLAVGVGGSY